MELEKRICVRCGKEFEIEVKEQLLYKGLDYPLPKRCFSCRQERKLLREQEEKYGRRIQKHIAGG